MHHRTQAFKQRLLISHGPQLIGLRWEVLFQSFRYCICKNGQRTVVTPLVPGVYIAFRSSLAEHRASEPCLSSFPLCLSSGAILSFLSLNVKVLHRFLCQAVGTFRRWPYWFLEVSFDGFQSSSSSCLPSLPPDPCMCEQTPMLQLWRFPATMHSLPQWTRSSNHGSKLILLPQTSCQAVSLRSEEATNASATSEWWGFFSACFLPHSKGSKAQGEAAGSQLIRPQKSRSHFYGFSFKF